MYRLLIVANSQSIHTKNLKTLVEGYFSDTIIVDSRQFSLFSPLKLLKSALKTKKIIHSYQPSFIILYQIDVASWVVSLIKKRIPTLVVGIGSDILTIADKSFLHKMLVRGVIRRGNYFNAGSIAIKNKMQRLANRPIDVVIANLGVDDITPKPKQDIIFSNRLHKNLYNIDKIIAAFKLFIANPIRKDWLLIIASTGNEDKLRSQVKELKIENNVKFVGWLDKKTNDYYYSISKIWISLPQSDSISISLLEAMSAECFPICFDVPALKGFLEDKINAILINNFENNFIERAFELDMQQIVKKNRLIARKFADKNLNKQRFYNIFNQALRK